MLRLLPHVLRFLTRPASAATYGTLPTVLLLSPTAVVFLQPSPQVFSWDPACHVQFTTRSCKFHVRLIAATISLKGVCPLLNFSTSELVLYVTSVHWDKVIIRCKPAPLVPLRLAQFSRCKDTFHLKALL